MKIQVVFLVLFCWFVAGRYQAEANLYVKNLDRNIDIRSQIAKITNKLVIENNSKAPVSNFLFAIEPREKDYLSYISAHLREHGKPELQIKKATNVPSEYSQPQPEADFYVIELRDILQPERSVQVEIELTFTHILTPYPKEIFQKEKQLVKYLGNLYLFSPYTVLKQTTTVILPSRSIENYSKVKPVTQTDANIIYGPYDKKGPFSVEELMVHFENNNKFLTVTNLERVIEVSHWGNIAVEETVNMLHTGALLKGPFSRYEYTREYKSGQPSIQSFETVLPASASDIYYRDDIGNISTSHTRLKKDSVEVNLRPRFPLFGGWKTKYILGYNVPSYEYLFHSGEEYVLEMRFLDHIYDDMVVEDMTLKIILPEGAHSMQVVLPFEAHRLPDSLHFTYLDITGRPTLSFTKKNLDENHIQNFKLKYVFPRILMLREPLIVTVALFLLFLLVIIYVRLDFSIDKDEVSEGKLRIRGHCERILAAQDRRVNTYNELDDQLSSLKAHKEVNTYLSSVKSINQEYKTATSAITELSHRLKVESGDIYEKIQELQKYDRNLKEIYNQLQSLYVDKLVPGKIGRQQFIEAESAILKKKEECVEKINSIVKILS